MSKGRGSALLVAIVVIMLVFQAGIADAATYTVGGARGWTFNVQSWPRGRRFRAGDILVFNYNPSFHNLVVVNKGGYFGCTASRGDSVYQSGRDQIRLARGENYFICTYQGHCQSGMRIAINAV